MTAYDKLLRATLERTLAGEVPDAAWQQAGVSVADGGLGMRRATDIAAPAFIASCVEARPFVKVLFGHLTALGLDPEPFVANLDATWMSAVNVLRPMLSNAGVMKADGFIQDALEATEHRVAALVDHLGPAAHGENFAAEAVLLTPPRRGGSKDECCPQSPRHAVCAG